MSGEPVAAVEADQRTTVWNEEHGDLVVVLDLPAQTLCVEPLGPVHVLDTEQDGTHVRFHACLLWGLVVMHDSHATYGSVIRASRFLIALVTCSAMPGGVVLKPAHRPCADIRPPGCSRSSASGHPDRAGGAVRVAACW